MTRTIGLITANYSVKDPSCLAEGSRPVASLPYGGRYRLIDFPLSNMVNCGIRTVGLVMPFNYRSIIDHVESGRDWALDRKKGGLFMLPGTAFGTSRTGSRFLLRDVLENKIYLERSDADYVICSACNFVFNADLSELIDAHEKNDAQITVLTHKATADDSDTISFGIEDGQVKSIKQGVVWGDTEFLDCFVIDRVALLDLLEAYKAVDHLDLFEAIGDDIDRVVIKNHNFTGYAAPIFNVEDYFARNMDLLQPSVNDMLFPEDRPVRTKAHDNPPAKYENGCSVHSTLVAAGCRIYGAVNNSILGRGVVVEPGATVNNAIIGQGCVVERGARVENAIIDRGNTIAAGTELRGTNEQILVKEKGYK